ncbi:hypothetical protein OFO30_35255, partial [Escherichia coli]|nr:hypothetical protein [Escherichia coli]
QYGYTEDGLLLYVYEPDNDPATSASTPGPGGYGGHGLTKRLEEGSRKYPTKTCVASMDADAWGGACTTHYYDYAGRVLTNVLPDGS